MENVTVKDILKVTGGRLLCGDENTEIRGFSIDSRQGGDHLLFVPIIGERVDAHRFIGDAVEINAATLTSEHDQVPEDLAALDKPWIRVEDTVDAMQKIGTWYRGQMKCPVIAVTGSVGKTTTREMIAAVLASGMQVYQTRGNQNSQIGVPLTLSGMSERDEAAVLEIGMSERGQIEKLTRMIRPDIAVVTVIGVSHIAQLGSQENICQEKMDIVKGLPEDGMVFLNGDDPRLAVYRGRLPYKLRFYGLDASCDYRAENIRMEKGTTVFDFLYREKGRECSREVVLGMMGEHNVRNALAGLGIAHEMGLDMEKAARALKDFEGQRLKVIPLASCTLIDDTYNASPDSMKASLKVLSDMETAPGGRKIAALADMLELGENEKEYHYQVGCYAASLDLDEILVFGSLAPEILRGIRESDNTRDLKTENKDRILKAFSDRKEMEDYLFASVRPEDILLLKGSNGMKLFETAKGLKDRETD